MVACWRDGFGFGPPALEGNSGRPENGRGSVARGSVGALGNCTRFATPIPCNDVANHFLILDTVTEPSAKITRIRLVGVAFSNSFIFRHESRAGGCLHPCRTPRPNACRFSTPAC